VGNRLTHPLLHRLRRLFRLPDHHVFWDSGGFVKPGCGLCEEFLAELLKETGKPE